MMSFKEFNLQEARDTKMGNYVCTPCDIPENIFDHITPETGKKSKEYHITLMYSTGSKVNKVELKKDLDTRFKDYGVVRVTGADSFTGTNKDTACIVLKVGSPYITKIHEYLKTVGDLEHSYPEYQPHVTLFYDVNKEEADYWVFKLNTEAVDSYISYKGFESSNIVEDWNE